MLETVLFNEQLFLRAASNNNRAAVTLSEASPLNLSDSSFNNRFSHQTA